MDDQRLHGAFEPYDPQEDAETLIALSLGDQRRAFEPYDPQEDAETDAYA